MQEYLDEQEFNTIEWPSHSPDLNPIENVWGLLKDRVWERAEDLESKEDLIELIKDIFWKGNMIKLAIRRCYESMPYRMAKVVEGEGQSCGY